MFMNCAENMFYYIQVIFLHNAVLLQLILEWRIIFMYKIDQKMAIIVSPFSEEPRLTTLLSKVFEAAPGLL